MTDEELLWKCARFSVYRVEERHLDGRAENRDIVRHPGAVVILPLLPNDHICLIRNYRITVAATLVELPAGTREPHEPPEATAFRELAEETGYEAHSLDLLARFYPSPGIMDEEMFVFVANQLTAGAPHREPGERIENLVIPWDDALALVEDGTICDAKTICSLLLLGSSSSLSQSKLLFCVPRFEIRVNLPVIPARRESSDETHFSENLPRPTDWISACAGMTICIERERNIESWAYPTGRAALRNPLAESVFASSRYALTNDL